MMLCASIFFYFFLKLKYLLHNCWWLNECRGYFSVSSKVLPENLNTFPWRPQASNMTFAKAHQSSSPPNIHRLCQHALWRCLTNCSTMHPLQFHMLDSKSMSCNKASNWICLWSLRQSEQNQCCSLVTQVFNGKYNHKLEGVLQLTEEYCKILLAS